MGKMAYLKDRRSNEDHLMGYLPGCQCELAAVSSYRNVSLSLHLKDLPVTIRSNWTRIPLTQLIACLSVFLGVYYGTRRNQTLQLIPAPMDSLFGGMDFTRLYFCIYDGGRTSGHSVCIVMRSGGRSCSLNGGCFDLE